MAKQQFFYTVFSILLLPANLCCAFWLFREALSLTGTTFKEFIEKNNSKMLHINGRRHRTIRVQRILAEFFRENSSDPQKSIRLTKTFGFCTLPGLAALSLAALSAISPSRLKYVAVGDLILVVINIALVVWGRIYRRRNPIDEATAEKLRAKKERSGKGTVKNVIVYALVGALLLGMLLFFMLGIAGVARSQPDYQPSAIATQADLITVLDEKGYETANVPTTYWKLDENKLEHIAAGVKGDSKFEFYGYSDSETVDLVYNRIVYLTASDMEADERESHETALPNGSKMFTAVVDDVYYLVMYKSDTVIYAYSPDSLNEINAILTEIGYLNNR